MAFFSRGFFPPLFSVCVAESEVIQTEVGDEFFQEQHDELDG